VIPFLRGFLLQPREVATLFPSSRSLELRLSRLHCLRDAQSVVELGPGTGGTTQALLGAMSSSARLLCIEVVREYVEYLGWIEDHRLRVQEGSAHQLGPHLERNGITRPDVIVSGIPFSMMTRREGRDLVNAIHAALAPGGTFVAYQLRDRISELAGERFGPARSSFLFWNIPPLRILQWRKDEWPPTSRERNQHG